MDSGLSETEGQVSRNPAPVYPPAKVTRVVLHRGEHRFRDLYHQLRSRRVRAESTMPLGVLGLSEGEVPASPGGPTGTHRQELDPDGIGICLSGGGIRAASYALGALQAMGEEGMLFGKGAENPCRAKYLSAVSGGSYMATALTLVTKGPVQDADKLGDRSINPFEEGGNGQPEIWPFAPGSPEEKYIRNHTLYLTDSKGGIPGTIWRAVLGFLLNTFLMAWLIGTVAILLGWIYGWGWPGLRADCPNHCANGGAWAIPGYMWWAAGVVGGVAVATGFVWIAFRWKTDGRRTAAGAVSGTCLVVFILIMILGIAIPQIIHLARPPLSAASSAGAAKNATVAGSTLGLLALVGTWIAAGRKIISSASGVEEAAIKAGEKAASQNLGWVFKIAAFLGGPVLVFSVVTIVAFYGAGYPPGESAGSGWAALIVWAVATVLLFLVWRRSDVTTWSLYPLYRRRLSTAFVLGRVRRDDVTEPSPTAVGDQDADERPYAAQYHVKDCQPDDLPELLVCAAANISDKNVTPAGSSVTSFVFSRDWIGGPLVGAVTSEAYGTSLGEGTNQARFATLPTAMALSGAAFAPSMGRMTKPWLRLYMVLANLRLGVWIPNPRRLKDFEDVRKSFGRQLLPRPDYLIREIFGRNHLDAPFLYVSDGGHYENLGMVELLRRRVKTIWCIDASGDQIDTFNTIGGAFMTANAELGVSFDVDPSTMAPKSPKPTDGSPWFVESTCCGGTFTYADGSLGRLVIVKAGVPKNAPWSIRSYQKQHKQFPCDPTLDQLFDGDRFEAYRELGRYSVQEALKEYSCDGEERPPSDPAAPEIPARDRAGV
jgi:hypothetical protein